MEAASRPAPEEAGGMYLSYSMNEAFCQTYSDHCEPNLKSEPQVSPNRCRIISKKTFLIAYVFAFIGKTVNIDKLPNTLALRIA
jgi:hypothetical protein